MTWNVELDEAFEAEVASLPEDVREALLAAARLLEEYGPQLGRPHVDTLKGSKHANMKELRFEAADGERRGESSMCRNLRQIIAELPTDSQARIEARYRELKDDIEGLRELRRIAGKAQAEIASVLKIKQPSVSKMEKQADMYVSTLRSYVEAVGGELDLVVRLPRRRAIHLHTLGDVFVPQRKASLSKRRATTGKRATRSR